MSLSQLSNFFGHINTMVPQEGCAEFAPSSIVHLHHQQLSLASGGVLLAAASMPWAG